MVHNRKASCCTLLKRITKLKCVNSEFKSVDIDPNWGCLNWPYGTMSESPQESHQTRMDHYMIRQELNPETCRLDGKLAGTSERRPFLISQIKASAFVSARLAMIPGTPCVIQKGRGRKEEKERSFTSVQMLHTHNLSPHNVLTLTLPHTTCSTPILHHIFSLSFFPHAIFTFLLLLVGRR